MQIGTIATDGSRRSRLAWLLAPRADRPAGRPPHLEHGLEDRPGAGQTAALAAQQVAIQGIYLILPGLAAAKLGLLPIDVVNFLCLSVAAVGFAGLLQVLPRGPLGSGYPVASIPSPVFVAVYLLAAPGASLPMVGALVLIAGVAGAVLSGLLRRLQRLVPSEVAGVVIFLIGLSLLPRAFDAATAADQSLRSLHGALTAGTLAVMIAVALKGGRFARFAVLVGALPGSVAAALMGMGLGDPTLLDTAPWLAIPRPVAASFAGFDAGLLPAFLVALLASVASWTGDLVAFQRAADDNWRQPDTPPIRRGLLAQSLAVALAGAAGAMPPATSSACVGLAIATRTLARRVAVWSSVALLALACSPKLLGLVLLLPQPVVAAMLGYVCCFMVAAGCQLMTSRMLDARRTFTIGIGIAIGTGSLLGLELFEHDLPLALRSPVTSGALVAIALNLVTAPLVARRASFAILPGPGMSQAVIDEVEVIGGAWGARRQTMEHVGHALLELAELLQGRGDIPIQVQAVHETDRILVSAAWSGAPVPKPSRRPDVTDLERGLEQQEAFALWLATRHADTVEQRATPGGHELRLAFLD